MVRTSWFSFFSYHENGEREYNQWVALLSFSKQNQRYDSHLSKVIWQQSNQPSWEHDNFQFEAQCQEFGVKHFILLHYNSPVSSIASTNVRIHLTQFSKLYGVICAASRTRNAKLSQHFTKANGSWGYNSFSTFKKNSLVSTGLVVKGWISPSRPTRIQLLPVLGDNSGEVLLAEEALVTSSESEV